VTVTPLMVLSDIVTPPMVLRVTATCCWWCGCKRLWVIPWDYKRKRAWWGLSEKEEL